MRRLLPAGAALSALFASGCTLDLTGPVDPAASAPAAPPMAAPAPTPECNSLFGQPLFAPDFDDATRTKLTARLNAVRDAYADDSDDADVIFALGRRMADLGMWRGALSLFDEGVHKHDTNARLRDARGTAHLVLRQFDAALADFEYAAGLFDAKVAVTAELADEDGAVAWRIPLHTGIARFVRGDFAGAARDFAAAENAGVTPEERCEGGVWGLFTLGRLGRAGEIAKAAESLAPLGSGADHPWADLARLFRGDMTVAALLPDPAARPAGAPDVDAQLSAAETVLRYGVANWLLVTGHRDQAIAELEAIQKSARWADRCAIAAEADLRDPARLSGRR